MPTRNINLTEHLDRYVEARVNSGRYGNASELMREGLRLLQQREREEKARLKWLRSAVAEGLDQIDRGKGLQFHSTKQLENHIDQLRKEALLKRARKRG